MLQTITKHDLTGSFS